MLSDDLLWRFSEKGVHSDVFRGTPTSTWESPSM